MSVGKRLSTAEPLTEHDVAERLSHAMERTWRIIEEVVGDPALHQGVYSSRYLNVHPDQLIDALQRLKQPKHAFCLLCRDGAFSDDGHKPVDP